MQRKQKKIQEETLPALIDNAYDFLGSALNSLEKDTKRSVIDFYTAVELFLKAPLLHEHWSLIVSRDPQLTKFLNGDFVSVNLNESIKRLKDVLAIEIPPNAKSVFDKVRQHRNKYVHFFMSEDQDPTAQVALEQLSAWAHLHSLMRNRLHHIFHKYEAKNQLIESSLKRHKDFWHAYAKLEYERLKEFFAEKRAAGISVTQCPTCAVDSLIATKHENVYIDFHCRICRSFHHELKINCPECKKDTTLTQDGYSYCEHCPHSFAPHEVFEALNTHKPSKNPGDVIDDIIPANCEYCEGYETVCELNSHYLCSNCLILTTSIGQCGYCLDYTNMSDTPDSYAHGCAFCDGAVGNANW